MREIKFRVWCGERLRFVNTLGWVDGELDFVHSPKYNGPIEDEVVLMQYTGLKDKNGREIYENDVVQRILMAPSSRLINEDFIGQVRFLEGAWLIDNGRDAIPLWSEADELIVLGNIYENPELLGDSK